jgi:hypothetical protein
LHHAPVHAGSQSRWGGLSNADAKAETVLKTRDFTGENELGKFLATSGPVKIWRNLRSQEKFHQAAIGGATRLLWQINMTLSH